MADYYGYGNLSNELIEKATKIINETTNMKPGIRKTMKLEEFESMIYDLDHSSGKKIYDMLNELYMTSILSTANSKVCTSFIKYSTAFSLVIGKSLIDTFMPL